MNGKNVKCTPFFSATGFSFSRSLARSVTSASSIATACGELNIDFTIAFAISLRTFVSGISRTRPNLSTVIFGPLCTTSCGSFSPWASRAAFTTSWLVTRSFNPLPFIFEMSTPMSFASFRVAGNACTCPCCSSVCVRGRCSGCLTMTSCASSISPTTPKDSLFFGCGASCFGWATGSGLFSGNCFFWAACLCAAGSSSVSIVNKISPTRTVWPSAKFCFNNFPPFGAGISTTAFPVSTSTTASSAFSVSPSFLSHFKTWPSAIPSPTSGKANSNGIASPNN